MRHPKSDLCEPARCPLRIGSCVPRRSAACDSEA